MRIREENKRLTRKQRRERMRARRSSFKERMTLSPLQKFARHNKFPFKILTHLLMVQFSVAYILLHNFQYTSFVNSNEASFR